MWNTTASRVFAQHAPSLRRSGSLLLASHCGPVPHFHFPDNYMWVWMATWIHDPVSLKTNKQRELLNLSYDNSRLGDFKDLTFGHEIRLPQQQEKRSLTATKCKQNNGMVLASLKILCITLFKKSIQWFYRNSEKKISFYKSSYLLLSVPELEA